MRFCFAALILVFLLFERVALPAACCLGGTPRTFIALQPMQAYEVGLSTTYRTITGYYNAYGEVEGGSVNQTVTWLWGAGARLTPSLESFAAIPFVYQSNGTGPLGPNRFGVGDVNAGLKYTLLQGALIEDWRPTLSLLFGGKAPSGQSSQIVASRFIPGTGNGLWEVFAGLLARKELGFASVSASFTVTARLQSGNTSRVDDGDKIESVQSVSIPFSRQLALSAGSSQTWTLSRRQNGKVLEDAGARKLTVFAGPAYFPRRTWSIQFALEGPPPLPSVGVNEVEATSLSMITKVGFY